MKSSVKVHGVGFSMDLDCFHRSPLPEASCCPVDPCSLPVNVVVSGVGMYSYPIVLIPLLYCLLVFTYSGLQCSFGLSNVYLTAILAGNLVDHFFLLLFRHLLLHFHKQLFQRALGLEDSFHPKGCTGLLYLLTEDPHIGNVECFQWLFNWWLFTYLLSSGLG